MSFTLIACPNIPTISCGSFDSAQVAPWALAESVGDTVEFVNQFGERIELTLVNRLDSQPYQFKPYTGGGNFGCKHSSVRHYDFSDDDAALRMTYRYVQRPVEQTKNQLTSSLSLRPESRSGQHAGYGFVFYSLEAATTTYPTEYPNNKPSVHIPMKSRIRVNQKLGNRVFEQIIEQRYELTDTVPQENEHFALRRVLIAKGVGLLQFERLNGEIFTQVSVFD